MLINLQYPQEQQKSLIKFKNINIFNPEFLTERNAIEDFNNQNRIILGGERPYTTKIKQVYSKFFQMRMVLKQVQNTLKWLNILQTAF